MTCVRGVLCLITDAKAASRSVQPRDARFARKSRAAVTLLSSAGVDCAKRLLVARRVRRRCHALERYDGADLHVDRQFAQRMLLEEFALQGVTVAVAAPPEREDLGVGDLDALLGVREDRENACLEDVP